MARPINTFDVVACNRALEEAGLSCRIHLHDACGRQSLSYERLAASEDAAEDAPSDSDVRAWLREFFAERSVLLEFDDEAPVFWVA